MNNRKLLTFSVITLGVIIAAVLVSQNRAPTSSIEKSVLFPGLAESINDVTTIALSQQGKNLTLTQKDKIWGIKESDGYPADFGKVRETVIAVSELMILSEKTSNPQRYARLGVENPEDDGAKSLLLGLKNAGGETLAELIVGQSRHSKSPSDKPGLYVRLPDSQKALLVEGRLELKPEAMNWFQRDLFDISADRVKKIHIRHPDTPEVLLERKEDIDDFSMPDVPAGKELQSNVVITRMGTLLENMFVDNVISASRLTGADTTSATVEMFDGLTVEIQSAEIDGKNYSSFSFSADNSVPAAGDSEESEKENKPDPLEQAESLNASLQGWAYAIPDFKYELFVRPLSDLIRDAGSAEKETSDE